MHRKSNKGAVLVFVLLISVIILILIFSMILNSQYGLTAKMRSEALSLAETGVEFARGSLQVDPGTTQQNSQGLSGSSALTYAGGGTVTFPPYSVSGIPFTDIAGQQAYGVPVQDRYGAVKGYFAYIMSGTDPVHCYSMGCVGSAPDKMEEGKRILIHVQFKPYTYSEFTKFFGNPSQVVNIAADYYDPFYDTPVYEEPQTGDTIVDPGTWLDPGGTQLSFNKTFTAGDMKFYPSKNASASGKSKFIGFSKGTYYSPRDTSATPAHPTRYTINSAESQTVYLNDKSGLYAVEDGDMGMPTSSGRDTTGDDIADETSQVEKVMNDLKAIATAPAADNTKSIYIEGNRTIIGDLTTTYDGVSRTQAGVSYPEANRRTFYSGDDTMYDYTSGTENNYRNKFITAKEDPTKVNDTCGWEYFNAFDASTDAVKHYGNGDVDPWDSKTYWAKRGDTTSSSDWRQAYRTIDPTEDYQNREYVLYFFESGGEGYVEISGISRDYGTGATMWEIKKDGTSDTFQATKYYKISDTNNNSEVKLIYLRGNARVYGKVKGKVTVAAEGKISVGTDQANTTNSRNGDLVTYGDHDGNGTPNQDSDYAQLRNGGASLDAANPSVIGLVSARKIVFDPCIHRSYTASRNKVDKFTVTATMMAAGSPPPNDASVPYFGTNSRVANKFTICANQKIKDANLNTKSRTAYWNGTWGSDLNGWDYTKPWTNINIIGSSVCFHRNKSMSSSYSNVKERYDQRLLLSQSPYFPVISKAWNIVGWAEVNMATGLDLKYSRQW